MPPATYTASQTCAWPLLGVPRLTSIRCPSMQTQCAGFAFLAQPRACACRSGRSSARSGLRARERSWGRAGSERQGCGRGAREQTAAHGLPLRGIGLGRCCGLGLACGTAQPAPGLQSASGERRSGHLSTARIGDSDGFQPSGNRPAENFDRVLLVHGCIEPQVHRRASMIVRRCCAGFADSGFVLVNHG